MLLKLIGSMIVIISTSFLGIVFSEDCVRRPKELRELQVMLVMLENEMGYLSNLLMDSFETIAKSASSKVHLFFLHTIDLLIQDRGMSAQDAWTQSVSHNIKRTSLHSEDGEVLTAFGKMLGSSDIEGQIKNIRMTLDKLKIQEKKAEESRLKNERMFKSLGVLGGIAIVIILA